MATNSEHLHAFRKRHPQQGTALVISLVMLVIITLLSVSAMRSSNLESKVSVNHQFKELSFQAAENALAQLTGPTPNANRPTNLGSVNAITNPAYYSSVGVADQPDLSADLTLEMTEISPPGKYKFSGYSLNLVTILFQADAVGNVAGNNTRSNNRMEVGLIRN